MKLFVASSGGIGGLRLSGEVDTRELPPELAERAERLLRPDALESSAAPNPGAADVTVYDVEVPEGRGTRRFRIDGSSADPEVVATLNDVMHELVRRRRRR